MPQRIAPNAARIAYMRARESLTDAARSRCVLVNVVLPRLPMGAGPLFSTFTPSGILFPAPIIVVTKQDKPACLCKRDATHVRRVLACAGV
jgi:hypothetical protein